MNRVKIGQQLTRKMVSKTFSRHHPHSLTRLEASKQKHLYGDVSRIDCNCRR